MNEHSNQTKKQPAKKKQKIYTVEAAVASTEMEINDELAVAKELVAKATTRKKTFDASKQKSDSHGIKAGVFVLLGIVLFTLGFISFQEWDCLLGKYTANILWILSGMSTLKATYHLIKGGLK